MLTKNEIKYLKALHQKKEREALRCFLCEGDKVVMEAIESGWKIKELFFTSKSIDNLNITRDFRTVTSKEMDQISGLSTAPGSMALIEFPEANLPSAASLEKETFLILDGINDPGNLGTIIRIADWYNIKHIFCSKNSVDCFNAKVVQASMGSIFRVSVHYLDLPRFLADCKNQKIELFAAVMNGEVANQGFMKQGGLILGSESHGISNELLSSEIHQVTIPRSGKAESLNVGVATGILLSMIR